MPGEKKRDRLVAQLLVGHARAVFVLRVKKHREKITGVAAASAAFADDTVENALDEGDFALDEEVHPDGSVAATYDLTQAGADAGSVLSFAVDSSGNVYFVKPPDQGEQDRKSTRLNSSHVSISYAVFCLKK